MNCNPCESYECVEVLVNPCSTGTALGIEADETGSWVARLSFAGVYREFGISVTMGESISILTALLNENGVHELQLYDNTDTLFGCYKVRTRISYNVPDAPVPSPYVVNGWEWDEVESAGNTVAIDADELSPIIWLDSNPINWANNGITFIDGVLDMSAIGGFTGTISYQYK
jgi:hypothetical protein